MMVSRMGKVKTWVGYKVHVRDKSTYELPNAHEVTRAYTSDDLSCIGFETIFRKTCEYQANDKGYGEAELLI